MILKERYGQMRIPELFASSVFGDDVMKERLSEDVYSALKRTTAEGAPLDPAIAAEVASAMKDWAIEKGATHFSHWFQPMTGITAEKHESFISVKDGKLIMDFSGKELIKGEPDASSFPSGGLRATFEARGYTAWDPSSYAFIKEGTLCIPTAFCSFGGLALDKKTPLLRSMEALNVQTLRILRLFGNTTVKRALPTIGAEQEYFLIDKEVYEKREDLIVTGRTLFGARSPKGQELNDHYFGTIRPRVAAFMRELDEELWKLGVYAKTEHNETAPSQHELAPYFTTANIAVDHNQLTMAIMKRVAEKHGMVCLLHEKPFANVNGSGKHNNWSITTDSGTNLLEPGSSPAENAQFILLLTAVIKAVDEYQDLLRMSVASAGNDHRLGGSEAPPAIISMFIGEDLEEIIEGIANGDKVRSRKKKLMNLGVDLLPTLQTDTTDRNRTSPFAFTGNKFEFRMPGSEFSISEPNIVLNTIIAEELRQFADELESRGETDFNAALKTLVAREVKKHRRIIFNGNNYSDEWVKEAEKRGLLNLSSADEAIPTFALKKNVEMFSRHGVFSEAEIRSRMEIMLENYCKTVHIEAATTVDMVRKQIYPAICKYLGTVLGNINLKSEIGADIPMESEKKLAKRLSEISDGITEKTDALARLLSSETEQADSVSLAHFCRREIIPLTEQIRALADEAETMTDKSAWPFPTYVDLLFSV